MVGDSRGVSRGVSSSASSSESVTNGIRIAVDSRHMPEHEEEAPDRRVFGYWITITNESYEDVQLIGRHWVIIDGEGECVEIDGDGVLQSQPRIPAGERYTYASFCPLRTDWGTMEGHYTFQRADSSTFQAAIARFHLFVSTEDAKRSSEPTSP